MAEISGGERLARVEASVENIEKVVLRMDGKLENIASQTVSKSELALALGWRDEKMEELKEGQRWLSRMLITAVTGGIISLVISIVVMMYRDGRTH